MSFIFTLMGKQLAESVGRVVTEPSRAEVSFYKWRITES